MKIINYKLKIKNSESGVTLLLSVLILAGLTLTALAVGAFAIQEIRASRSVTLTEPAITAANTGGEQGLWAIKRGTALTNCTSGASSQNLGTNTLVSLCKSYGVATFSLKANTPFVFYLYDPNNINGDTDLSGFPINWLSAYNKTGTTQVNVQINRIDSTGTFVGSAAVNPGSTQTITINNSGIPSGGEARMKVTLSSTGNNTVDVNTNQGMPTFPTVDSTGCSSKSAVNSCSSSQELFSRRINIIVPQQ